MMRGTLANRPAVQPPFVFTQSNLQDFDRCPRLFYLRWVARVEWPQTTLSREREADLLQRSRFHRLVQQWLLNISVTHIIEAEPAESPLRTWWQAFRDHPPALPAGPRFPEVELAAPIGEHVLLARMDLLVAEPRRRLTIFDWKTGLFYPRLERLRESWQTVVYRYLAVEAGAPYFGEPAVPPDAVEMIYWFSEYPATPLALPYSAEEHTAAGERLRERVAQIASLPAESFTPCEDEQTCLFCPYWGYCGRAKEGEALAGTDIAAGPPDEWDWSDVPEFEY